MCSDRVVAFGTCYGTLVECFEPGVAPVIEDRSLGRRYIPFSSGAELSGFSCAGYMGELQGWLCKHSYLVSARVCTACCPGQKLRVRVLLGLLFHWDCRGGGVW